MKTENRISFIDRLEEYQKILKNSSADWLNAIRVKNFDQFEAMGLPTVKNEEWKYTNLAELSAKRFHVPDAKKVTDIASLTDFLNSEDINIVFVDGNLALQFSNLNKLPKGVRIVTIADAAQKNEAALRESFNRTTPNDAEAFLSLNHALHKDGIFIGVEAKVVIKPLIHIVYLSTSDFKGGISFPKTVIDLNPSSEASVLESHISFEAVEYFSNALTDIFIQDNAVLNYCKAQSESVEAFHVSQTRIWQKRDSQLNAFSFTNGGKLTRNNLCLTLEGEGTNSVINGLYLMEGTQHVDNHSLVDNQQPNCTNRQLYKGILNGQSRAVFNGKIFVRQIAQKTNAYQLNKNLLLGDNCRIDTKPQLEIFADDVKCTHGATIGQLNEDELFYLRSRAISKADAKKMLAKGFVDDIIQTIPSESIRQKLNHLTNRSLEAID